MYLEEDLISQPLEIGKCSIRTAPRSFLQGKSPSENHSSTVNSAIIMSEITGTNAQMMAHGVLIHQMIQTLIRAIRIKCQSGYYSSAPATDVNSTRTVNSGRNSLFLQYPRKARGQVTVAATVTAIMTNHCSSQKEKNFTQVKADSFRDFRSIQCSLQPI